MIQDLDNEIWVPVAEYHGLYEVSNMGRIKTLARTYYGGACPVKIKERLRKLTETTKGYLALLLSKDTISVHAMVHRIVAQAFIPNLDNKPQVNHKNGIKTDNRVENLEWVTNKENCIHSWQVLNRKSLSQPKGEFSKFSKKIKCDTLDMTFNSIKEACQILGLTGARISEVCKGIKNHTRGFTFRYL